MPNSPDMHLPWSEQFRIVARKWVDADAAARLLEETKSAFHATLIAQEGDMPVSRAEVAVRSSVEWKDFIKRMCDARTEAAKRKVQMEYLRMKFMEWQSENATKRAEMKL